MALAAETGGYGAVLRQEGGVFSPWPPDCPGVGAGLWDR